MEKISRPITKKEYEKALEIVERYKYQQNPTIQVSIEYNATITSSLRLPANWGINQIKEELNGGVPDYFDREDADKIEYGEIKTLIVNGEEIDLKNNK